MYGSQEENEKEEYTKILPGGSGREKVAAAGTTNPGLI
jgi:hypothetical protein